MRVVRFLNEDSRLCAGQELDTATAQLVDGDRWGPWRVTDRRERIARRLAPIEPVNIFCVGLNYRDHARETGAPEPKRPVLFMKPTSTVTSPQQAIRIPACCTHGPEVDYEGELAVVIGQPARNVAEADALGHVLGYTCANDVSARRWQKQDGGGQWVRGKSFDTFCPLGPVLVTADEIPDPQVLRIRTTVNGQLMQDHTTADMIFPVAQLISDLSADTTLLPGTVILTGTPAGVGFARQPPVFLSPGDEVTVEIEKIGRLTNRVE